MNMSEQTYDVDSESMVCTDCDATFHTEVDYTQHRHIHHKSGLT